MTLEGTIVHVAITNAKGTIKEHRNPILESRCKSKRSDRSPPGVPVPAFAGPGREARGNRLARGGRREATGWPGGRLADVLGGGDAELLFEGGGEVGEGVEAGHPGNLAHIVLAFLE